MDRLFHPGLARSCRIFAAVGALITGVVGGVGFGGAAFAVPVLSSWGLKDGEFRDVRIAPNTALCFVLLAISLFLQRQSRPERPTTTRNVVAQATAAMVCLVAALSLTEFFLGWDLGIDRLFAAFPSTGSKNYRPNLMSPMVAVAFLLLATALLILEWRIRQNRWPAQYLCFGAAIAGVFGFLPLLLEPRQSSVTMSLPTTVNCLLMSVAILCSRERWAVDGLLVNRGTGAKLFRRILPVALLLLSFVVWSISKTLVSAAHLSWALASVVAILCGTVVIAFVTWIASLMESSSAQNVELERRVAERTVALQQSEVYLAEAQRLSHTGSFAFEVASNSYIYISDECFRIFELDPQQGFPTREAVSRLIHPEDWERVQGDFEKLLREKVDTSTEFRVTLPSGTTKYLHAIRHPVLNNAGDVVQVVGTVLDITERKRAEEALRESESRFRALFDHAADAFFVVDDTDQGIIIDVNRQACEGLGYTRAELLGMSAPTLAADADAGMVQRIREGIAGGNVHTFELRHRRKDGTVFPIEVRVRLFEIGGHRLHLASARDITDRKRAEEERRQSTERFRAVADYTYDWENWIGVDGKLLWVNPAVERITGYTIAECMAMPDFPMPIVAEPDRQPVASRMREAVQGSSRNDFEFRVRHKDGGLAWVAASWQPIYDSQGVKLGYRSSIRDIAERKRAEQALRESETRFRTFVDHAAEAFFMLDFDSGIIIDVNRTACESLGFNREELIGKTPLAFDKNLDRATLDCLAIDSLAERAGAAQSVLFDRHWHRRKDGSAFPVEIHTTVVWYSGRRFFLMVARDITDRVQAEEQRDKLRQLEADLAHINRVSMMGELAASIAHEVNQPLSGVVSNGSACLRWLSGDVPNLEEAREAARRIVRDGKRAGEVIARIRALTTKRAALPTEKLDLHETILEVMALVRDEAKRRNATIRTEFGDELSPVSGDRVQLQQVLLNLVMNGMEAMSGVTDHPRELIITARNFDAVNVQLMVQDSGIGLDPNTTERIFDPFYSTKAGGMGMGLSVCRSIIRNHGGRLWATPNGGCGASFLFTLPKYNEEEANAGAAGI